jgi:hypothetical protein
MAETFRIERHIRKHDEQSKLLTRVILFGLLLGLILPWKYLTPFSNDSVLIKQTKLEIQNLDEKYRQVSEQKKLIDSATKVLEGVQSTVQNQPWISEAEKLRLTFSRLREEGTLWSDDQHVYQQAADNTVRKVASEVERKVILPLESAIEQQPELREAINNWKNEHLGQIWYGTVTEKGANIEMLTSSMEEQLRPLNQLINISKQQLDAEIDSLTSMEKSYEDDLKSKNKENSRLNSEMQDLFPSWLKGIVRIEQVIQLFPFLVLALTFYAWIAGWTLSRHHEFVVRNLELSDADKTDPAISSIWTLTSKGSYGTSATLATYYVFLLVMWASFERGCYLLLIWLTTSPENAWFTNESWVVTLQWVGRLAFVIVAVLVSWRPLLHKPT